MGVQGPTRFRFDYWLWDQLQRKGMTQAQLSKKTGLDPSAISLYLSRRRVPNIESFLKILSALELNIYFRDAN